MKFDCYSDGVIYLSGEEKLITEKDPILTNTEHGVEFCVYKTNMEGVFRYNCKQPTPNGPQIWSSRASVMNKKFDLCLIEAAYKKPDSYTYEICAIDLVRFESFLKDAGYIVEWNPIENTNHDITYGCSKIRKVVV